MYSNSTPSMKKNINAQDALMIVFRKIFRSIKAILEKKKDKKGYCIFPNTYE